MGHTTNDSASVICSELERVGRTRALIKFSLDKEHAYLQVDAKIHNRSVLPQPFSWWASTNVTANNYQSVFPPDVTSVREFLRRFWVRTFSLWSKNGAARSMTCSLVCGPVHSRTTDFYVVRRFCYQMHGTTQTTYDERRDYLNGFLHFLVVCESAFLEFVSLS